MSLPVLNFKKSQFAMDRMTSLYDLFENNEATDVDFVFTQSGQSKQISAHKVILAAESPVFKAMFYGPMKEKGQVKMIDVHSTAFMVFLQAIYHKFETINMDNIAEVMRLADKYDTQSVMDYCTESLGQFISVKNVCLIIGLALRYGQKTLMFSCDNIVSTQWKAVLKSDSFLEIDCTTLDHILQLNVVLRNEKETFDACIEWAKKSCERKLIEVTPTHLRVELGQCFAHINFNHMSQIEFVECEHANPIFTFDEYKNIITKFTNDAKNKEQKFSSFSFQPPLQPTTTTAVPTPMPTIGSNQPQPKVTFSYLSRQKVVRPPNPSAQTQPSVGFRFNSAN